MKKCSAYGEVSYAGGQGEESTRFCIHYQLAILDPVVTGYWFPWTHTQEIWPCVSRFVTNFWSSLDSNLKPPKQVNNILILHATVVGGKGFCGSQTGRHIMSRSSNDQEMFGRRFSSLVSEGWTLASFHIPVGLQCIRRQGTCTSQIWKTTGFRFSSQTAPHQSITRNLALQERTQVSSTSLLGSASTEKAAWLFAMTIIVVYRCSMRRERFFTHLVLPAHRRGYCVHQ